MLEDFEPLGVVPEDWSMCGKAVTNPTPSQPEAGSPWTKGFPCVSAMRPFRFGMGFVTNPDERGSKL